MISIIIVGYNSQKYLGSCLKSVFASSYENFRVILVDNNSSDDSVEFVKKSFQDVVIIKNEDNFGFAKANNIGIEAALKMGTDYVLILNPDTMLDEKCLEILVGKAKNKTILQPLILLSQDGKKTDLVNTNGNYLNFLGFSYCNSYKVKKDTVSAGNVTLGSGAGSFIPAQALRDNLFDEDFFMYHEDVDLFWRLRLAGYEIILVPQALIWHDYSFSRNKKKMFYAERNRLLFLFKNFSTKYLILILPLLLVNEILMIIFSLISGWLPFKLESYVSFFKLLPKKLRDKRLIKHKLTERELKKYLGAQIHYQEVSFDFIFLPYNAILLLYWYVIYFFI